MLPGGQLRIEGGLLERGADRVADPGALLDHVESGDPGGARGGWEKGGEHVDGGRLPGAVGSEEAIDLAGVDLEVDPVDGPDPTLELTGEARDLDPIDPTAVLAARLRSQSLISEDSRSLLRLGSRCPHNAHTSTIVELANIEKPQLTWSMRWDRRITKPKPPSSRPRRDRPTFVRATVPTTGSRPRSAAPIPGARPGAYFTG